MVSHILNGPFFPLFGFHTALRATYGKTLNTHSGRHPGGSTNSDAGDNPERNGDEGDPMCDKWVRFNVGGVSASLGPADRDLLLSPECWTSLCLIHT